jgi:sec-independent protein translocase protein TatA
LAPLAIFQDIGPWEIIIVLLIALVLFGGKKLPSIGKSMGRGIREFRSGIKGLGDDVKSGMDDEDKPAAKAPPAKDKSDG